jgi:hypothetical protein
LQKKIKRPKKKLDDIEAQQIPERSANKSSSKLSSYEKRKYGETLDENIEIFLKTNAEGPIYVCTCCHQTWFAHSVKPSDVAKTF